MASPKKAPAPGHYVSNVWLQAVLTMYPDILTNTHCVPPVHFNRVPYRPVDIVAGQWVLVRQPFPPVPQSSDASTCTAGRTHFKLSHVEVNCLPLRPEDKQVTQKNKKCMPRCQQPTKKEQPQCTRPFLSSVDENNAAHIASVYDSDLRDDFAQQHVLLHLQELAHGRREVMFILSQLRFSDYLNQPSYAAAVEAARLPMPGDLGTRYRSGEFDILLIHRHYGILIGEVKSVGIQQSRFIQSQCDADNDVAKRLSKAVRQLNRSEKVIKHLVRDIVPGLQLTVRKTIFLPYVSDAQLERVLAADRKLEKDVCQSLGAIDSRGCPDRAEAVRLCVCSDQLSDPASFWHVTPAVMTRFDTWWQRRMSATNTQLDERLYLELVSRFVGPASSKNVHCVFAPPIEVKSHWQAISELGRRLVLLVLSPKQIDLMTLAPSLICLTGPPGTGKSILLVLMGLQWLLEGHDVHVVSVFFKSLAASQLVAHQLRLTLAACDLPSCIAPGNVYFHKYNFWDCERDLMRAVGELTSAANYGRSLHVIMDEAWFGYQGLSDLYQQLVTTLVNQVPCLHLWAADVGHIHIPVELTTETLTVPLRYCSTVLREIEEGISLYSTVHDYTSDGLPTPAEGPKVVRLNHQGEGHSGRWPVQCFRCGQNVAELLFRIRVGCAEMQTPQSPPPLQYRDVFVLTRSSELQDDVIDGQGNVTSPASEFVQGLRQTGVPVCVLSGTIDDRWEQDLADVAVGSLDMVTAAHLGAVNGLERKIVVWLPGRMTEDSNYSEEAIEALDRLASVSRCTTQLIIVHAPPGRAKPARATHHSQCLLS